MVARLIRLVEYAGCVLSQPIIGGETQAIGAWVKVTRRGREAQEVRDSLRAVSARRM